MALQVLHPRIFFCVTVTRLVQNSNESVYLCNAVVEFLHAQSISLVTIVIWNIPVISNTKESIWIIGFIDLIECPKINSIGSISNYMVTSSEGNEPVILVGSAACVTGILSNFTLARVNANSRKYVSMR